MTGLLSWADPLPHRPRRILVAGASGAGKTTPAALLGERLGLLHVELDALHHGPDRTPRPSFVTDVGALADGPGWVTEWQYGSVRETLLRRADLLVFLDLPFLLVHARLVRRTGHRRVHRTALWNGNREPPLWKVLTDGEHILRLVRASHAEARHRMHAVEGRSDTPVAVRLRSPHEVAAWVDRTAPAT